MTLPTGSLVTKDPDATAWPRGIDWTAYLANIADDETIASSSWSVSGKDAVLTIDGGSPSIVTGNLKTQARFSGGTRGVRYIVTNRIVTSSGVHDDRSFVVGVRDC